MRQKRLLWALMCLAAVTSVALGQDLSELEARIERLESQLDMILQQLDAISTDAVPLQDDTRRQKSADEPTAPEVGSGTIAMELVSLSFHQSNQRNNWANDYRDWLAFSFRFTNHLDVETRAVRGTVVFTDLFGEVWWRVGITVTDPMEPGETMNWEGRIDFNSFEAAHRTARNTSLSDVSVHLENVEVVLHDGTRMSL